MGTAAFQPAIDRGEPLVDVSIHFRAGVDCESVTRQINALADDFDLHPQSFYDPQSRAGTATRGALIRPFGWVVERVQVPGSSEHFIWKTVVEPQFYPGGLEDAIERLGMSQPGADDSGQWYEYR